MPKYPANDAPPEVTKLVWQLVPQLIQGDHPALWALREQFRRARITEVWMTGVGFSAEFDVPEDAPLTDPLNLTGGDATITVDGLEHGAGCVLFVRGGRLSMIEGYSNAGEDWPDDAKVLAVSNVVSILSDL